MARDKLADTWLKSLRRLTRKISSLVAVAEVWREER
jgi:hypothetical protein